MSADDSVVSGKDSEETVADLLARPFVEKFSERRDSLIAVLRRARSVSFPNEEACQELERKTWDQLVITAIFHFGARDARASGREDAARKPAILAAGNAVKKARQLIEKCARQDKELIIKHPLYLHLGPKETGLWTSVMARSKDVLLRLAEIEAAAGDAVSPTRPRGRPAKTSAISNEFVHALARHYREYTGRMPEMGVNADFRGFVSEFLDAVKCRIEKEGVAAAIDRGRTWSLGNRGNSPFRPTPITLLSEIDREIVLPSGERIIAGPGVAPAELARVREALKAMTQLITIETSPSPIDSERVEVDVKRSQGL
jgi:hypothetical protein